MMARKGFTLVELMVVILIVAILAAIAIPIMRGRIDQAKWAEGKAMMGTIATSIRTYCAAENKALTGADKTALGWTDLGLKNTDFQGTYFQDTNFDWSVTYDAATSDLTFTITADNTGTTISSPTGYTLDQSGTWTEVTGPSGP